jgi:hypothetical protein
MNKIYTIEYVDKSGVQARSIDGYSWLVNFQYIKKPSSQEPKYFSGNPIVQEVEDLTRHWIPNVTKYRSVYKDQTGDQVICIFTGIGTFAEDIIWDACGIGWLYGNGSFAEKVSDDLEVNPAFLDKNVNKLIGIKKKNTISLDLKDYDSKSINQELKLKKVNKSKQTIKFY